MHATALVTEVAHLFPYRFRFVIRALHSEFGKYAHDICKLACLEICLHSLFEGRALRVNDGSIKAATRIYSLKIHWKEFVKTWPTLESTLNHPRGESPTIFLRRLHSFIDGNSATFWGAPGC